ncbi:MraY family glycosyltransferase [Porticoccaceae bacterium LTM1]|nr:MraY family glycosyltransferase [Porticoccaceae bacterium LTM1]
MLMQWLPVTFICVVSYLTTSLLVPLAHKVRLLDIPQGRKDHAGNIPLVGGISIYISVILSSAIFCDLNTQLMGLMSLGGLITLVGTLDDKYDLPAKFRLWIQILAGIALASGIGISLSSLGNLFGLGNIGLGIATIPVTAIAIAGITNAYNMTDGIDGLAGSMSLIAILGLLVLTYPTASDSEINLLSFMAASLAVFLLFNLQIIPSTHEKIFLGDAGSMFMGFTIAGLMIYFSQGENAAFTPATALWLVAVPLIDMISTMVRRILKKQSPFVADKTHLHHILVKGGLSRRQALVSLIIYGGTCASIGGALSSAPSYFSAALFIVLFLCHLYAFRHAYKASKQIKRLIVITRGLSNKLLNWTKSINN